MVRYTMILALLSSLFCIAQNSLAQQQIASPRDSVQISMNGKRISINYGRPSMRGRRIMGELVPYNRVWRTGANAATGMTITGDIQIGDAEIPRGEYTLYTFPSTSQWKLIINKQTGQWGTTYNPNLDFARVDLTERRLSTPVERLTLTLERTNGQSGMFIIEWENTSLRVPFKFLQDAFVASPRDSIAIVMDGKRVVIDYGRPSRRGRKIIGAVVPYGEVWRTGANEATSLRTEADLVIGGVSVPRGDYTLYTLPSENEWKLIINKETGQWGTEYNSAQDFARVDLKRQSLNSTAEKFTIVLEQSGNNSAVLKLLWENTQVSVNISAKRN